MNRKDNNMDADADADDDDDDDDDVVAAKNNICNNIILIINQKAWC
jgi:hypothetical protein